MTKPSNIIDDFAISLIAYDARKGEAIGSHHVIALIARLNEAERVSNRRLKRLTVAEKRLHRATKKVARSSVEVSA